MQETWVQSLGWEDPQEEETATHSSILAWRIPWTEEPGRLHAVHEVEKRQDRAHRLTCGISYLSLKREASPNRMNYSVGLKLHRHYHPSGGFCLTQRHKSKKFVHELLYFASCMSKVARLLIIFLQCILIHM